MTSFGRRNVKKHTEIKNSEKYIALEIYLKLGCMDNREVTYSESREYMGRLDKGLTTSLTIRTKSPNNEQKARTNITAISNHYFNNLLKDFKN